MGFGWMSTVLVSTVLLFAVACGSAGTTDEDLPRGIGGAGTSPTTPLSPSAPTAGSARGSAPSAEPSAPMDDDGERVPSEVSSLLEELNEASAAATRAPRRMIGADMSWPQCPEGMGIPEKRSQGQPLPREDAEFVVLGLTNGPAFTPNPCLADQVAWARERAMPTAAYAVVSYPRQSTLRQLRAEGPYDGSGRLGALRNVGYQAALHAVHVMRQAGLVSPVVWVDVEPVGSFEWSRDRVANAAVVEGTVRGYRDSDVRVGFYSTPYLWEQIVGNYARGAPEWRAAGRTSMAEALDRCGEDWSIQSGRAVFAQWVEDNRDRNVTCPGWDRDLAAWFHLF